MKVTFDTEADAVDDLVNILNMLNTAIQKRTGKQGGSGSNVYEVQRQEQVASNRQEVEQRVPAGGKTTGGGRVVPYQDMSNMMSNIFSNQSVRRSR